VGTSACFIAEERTRCITSKALAGSQAKHLLHHKQGTCYITSKALVAPSALQLFN